MSHSGSQGSGGRDGSFPGPNTPVSSGNCIFLLEVGDQLKYSPPVKRRTLTAAKKQRLGYIRARAGFRNGNGIFLLGH